MNVKYRKENKMIYTDTRDSSVKVDFRTAVLSGMNSQTGGLFIPTSFPKLSDEILNKVTNEPFNPQYYVDYLKEKYIKLYNI